MVRERWDSIIRIGQALAERRELSQAEVEELLTPPFSTDESGDHAN
jgi:hypothetical protein